MSVSELSADSKSDIGSDSNASVIRRRGEKRLEEGKIIMIRG